MWSANVHGLMPEQGLAVDINDGALGSKAVADRPAYPIESVDNAMRLLLLIEERGKIRVSEAGAALGTAVSTAHRLLAMLEYHGFVRRDKATKAYSLGPSLLRIGLSAVRKSDIRVQARPYLEELWEAVGETVHLALPQGTQVLFVDALEGSKDLRVASRTGTLMWSHCTSIGKAYLAFEPEERLLALYPNEELPALTPNSITSRVRLFEALAKVRQQGYAFNANESEEGIGSVAAPILGANGRAVASVNTAAPLVRLMDERRDNVVAATVRCAQQIGEVLLLSHRPEIGQDSSIP